MRITLETTEHDRIKIAPYPRRSIILEYSDDELDMNVVMEDLIRPMLIGWGFAPDTVAEALGEPS